MKIVVIGGTGVIGSKTVAILRSHSRASGRRSERTAPFFRLQRMFAINYHIDSKHTEVAQRKNRYR